MLQPKKNECIDHRNRDKLDNRRENLRIATHTINNRNIPIKNNNTSGCVGVSWYKERKKWYTTIKTTTKAVFLGYFSNFDDAVRVRKNAELKYFGEIIKR